MEIKAIDGNAKSAMAIIRSNAKFYKKLLDSLDILGFFDNTVIAEIFNVDKRLGKVEVSFTDKNEDLFILTSKSNNKSDLTTVRKLSDEDDISYDLSLIKKSDINNDNIDLCRVDKIYNTRHGRLISDRKTFATLFLGNTAYQLLSSFDKPIDIEPVINEINSIGDKPTFKEFIDAFGKNLSNDEIDEILEVNSYTDFERTSTIRFDELKSKSKSLVKKI